MVHRVRFFFYGTAEPCIVVAIFSSLCLFLPLAFPCLPKPDSSIDMGDYRFVRHACTNEDEYSPLATVPPA